MKKLTTFFTLFAAVFILSAPASALEKIAILDIEKIAKEAKVVAYIQVQVTKKQAVFQKEINKKQAALEADQKKLESRKNILSKEVFEKEQLEFEKKIDSLKELVEKKQNSLKNASTEAMSKVNEKMKDVVADIAKEKQIAIIIPASQIVFAVDGLDISLEVLEKLNKKVSTVEVKFVE